MKRISIGKAIVAALGISLAGSAFAYYRDGSYFDFAHVDRVDRLLATTDQPQASTQCWDQPRTEYHPGADYRRDTVEPAIDEDGKPTQVVTHSDVVESGGYSTTRNQRVCQTRTAHVETQQVVGYDVVYSYRGQDYHERMDHDPGRSVRVHVDHGYVELAE
jgi:hypothetical protein